MISSHFPTDSSAGTHRVRLLAPHLEAYGWRPTVLTVDEHAYEGRIDPALRALVPASLDVERIHALSPRLTRTVGFGDLGLRALPGLRRAAWKRFERDAFDAVFITIYPSYPAVLGPMIKRRFGVPVILDYQDPWVGAWGREVGGGADGAVDSRSRLTRALAERLEPRVLRMADGVTAVSERTFQEAINRTGARPRVTAEIPIGWDPCDIDALERRPGGPRLIPDDGRVNLCYTGTLLPLGIESLRAVLRAARMVIEREPAAAGRLRFYFFGTSNQTQATGERVMAHARELGVDSIVHEHPARLDYFDAPAVLRQASALLLMGSSEPHYTPSKVFPALLVNRPLLALYHERSTVISTLQAAAPSPAARTVTFGATRPVRTFDSGSFTGADVGSIGDAIAATRPDAVVVPGWHSMFYLRAIAACRRANIPVLYRGDSNLLTGPHGLRRLPWSLRTRAALKMFDGYLSVGTRIREYLRHFGAPEPLIFDSPHCVDNAAFAAGADCLGTGRAWQQARQEMGAGPGDFLVLFAGKFVEPKRPCDVIAAAARLGPDVVVAMAGNGPSIDATREAAKRLNVRVTWCGVLNQTAMPRALAAADCVAVPSETESWGLIVNEALATGPPCVVSSGLACASDLVRAGVSGAVYELGDIDGLAASLRQVREAALGGAITAETCRRVVAPFSIERATDGLVAATKRVNARKRTAQTSHAGHPRVLAAFGNMAMVSGVERMSFEVLRTLRERGAAVHCIVNSWESSKVVDLADSVGASWSLGYYWYELRRRARLHQRVLALWDVCRTSLDLLRDVRRFRPTHVFTPEYHAVLRSAVALLAQRGYEVTLDVVGAIDAWEAPGYEGYRERIRQRADAADLAGRVHFLGQREDVPALMAQASVHCMPSRPEQKEGFAVVALEAKRAGLPSVVTHSGALPEMVRHAVDGWVCPDVTAAAIAERLAHFLSDPDRARSAGEQARRLRVVDERGGVRLALARRHSTREREPQSCVSRAPACRGRRGRRRGDSRSRRRVPDCVLERAGTPTPAAQRSFRGTADVSRRAPARDCVCRRRARGPDGAGHERRA